MNCNIIIFNKTFVIDFNLFLLKYILRHYIANSLAREETEWKESVCDAD